ncbi:competence protein ComK [Bacillus cereus]|uniref:Competence protein ComK n=1 Tax=Bacillus cereus TaxID=1396 RepID=A0AA44TGR6_BACCE|nr:competence protein ComK [Bacillus cereus]PFN07024.1 competence protein ComK [Bacillus cereus]PFS08072.1 competence protein ComK [Bacillus cereus]PGZ12811.1 competence protein ComK [Bacillus cereus]
MQIRKLTNYKKWKSSQKLYKNLQLFKIIFIFNLYTKICNIPLLKEAFELDAPANLHAISSIVMMLLPYEHPFYRTQIHTTKEILCSPKTPLELIKELIISHNYSTYEGRRKAIIEKWNLQQNTPIPINHRRFICTIPTKSPKAWDCIWVSYKSIKTITKNKDDQAILNFYNGETMTLPISYYKMKQQWRKAGNLIAQMMLDDFHNDF